MSPSLVFTRIRSPRQLAGRALLDGEAAGVGKVRSLSDQQRPFTEALLLANARIDQYLRSGDLMDTILDYQEDIRFDTKKPKLLHAHAIEAHRLGLHHLASQVRLHEQQYIDANEWSDGGEVIEDFAHFEPITYCTFNWFAITLTSYLRLIALVDLVNRNDWSIADLVPKEKIIAKTCRAYVEDVVPAVAKWRNKVAAHPAATDPVGLQDRRRGADRMGTLLQSFSCPVSRTAGYFEVGRVLWSIGDEEADLLPWSVTATYERLTSRFWPDASIPPHRHRPGSEPRDEPGTHLRLARGAV